MLVSSGGQGGGTQCLWQQVTLRTLSKRKEFFVDTKICFP